MARDQARRLTKVETMLGTSSLQEQIKALSDMHLYSLAVLMDMNDAHDFMDRAALVRRFLAAVRRGRAFTMPGWTAAMNEEFAARRRQLQAVEPPSSAPQTREM